MLLPLPPLPKIPGSIAGWELRFSQDNTMENREKIRKSQKKVMEKYGFVGYENQGYPWNQKKLEEIFCSLS